MAPKLTNKKEIIMNCTNIPDYKTCGICRESMPICSRGHGECSDKMLFLKSLAPYVKTNNPKITNNWNSKIKSVFIKSS